MSAYYSRNQSYSRSLNAEIAEDEGRLPLTRAIPEVAKLAGCTRKVARTALEETWDGEWHHVGKYASEVKYYDITAAVESLRYSADPLEDLKDVEWSEEKSASCASFDRTPQVFESINSERDYFGENPFESRDPRGNDRRLNSLHAANLQRAASFRRWEQALRRLAEKSN